MGEQLKGEKGLAPESLEDQKFREITAMMDEETRLLAEIITARGTDAEESVRARVGPLLHAAREKGNKAMEEWLNLRNVSGK